MSQSEQTQFPPNLYRILFNHTADPILVLGQHGTFVEVNEAACNHLGYSREELLQMGPLDIDDEASANKVP